MSNTQMRTPVQSSSGDNGSVTTPSIRGVKCGGMDKWVFKNVII